MSQVGKSLWAFALLSLVFALDGCRSIPGEQLPTPSATPTASAEAQSVWVYYVGDTGTRLVLYREPAQVADGQDAALAALRYLTRAESRPNDPDYTNLWGNGTEVNAITYQGSQAVVDLAIQPLNVGSEAEARAIDQLVWTLTENHSGTSGVRFTAGGQPIETIAGHVDTTKTFTREPDYEVLAPIWVDAPTNPSRNPVRVTGSACTFEAGVAWELLQQEVVVDSGNTTAAEACPVRSTWTVDLGALAPGEYVFRAIDFSAEDGSVSQVDTKPIVVK
jgi:hypothetical protein